MEGRGGGYGFGWCGYVGVIILRSVDLYENWTIIAIMYICLCMRAWKYSSQFN